MINELIKEIGVSLKNDCWFVALNTALTLPDICGKAEFPEYKGKGKDKRRYLDWLKEYGRLNANNLISANDLYALRCCMSHQGTPSTKQNGKNIDEFELIVNSNRQHTVTMQAIYHTPDKYVLSINVFYICELLCRIAEAYYNSNKEKFDFFKYRAVSVDYRKANILSKVKDLFRLKFD